LGLVTLLDQIIDAATDSSASVPDLLRKVQVVARRVGTPEVEAWVRHELQGYPDDVELPTYRVVMAMPVGRFTGPLGRSHLEQLTLMAPGLEHYWTAPMRAPVQTLVSLASDAGDDNIGYAWSHLDVEKYEKSGVFTIDMMGLFSVQSRVSRDALTGVVDNIKSKAMELALDLQAEYPDAGEQGGPTVAAEPQLGQIVYNFTTTNNITGGHGTNVAVGSNIKQRSKVRVGDDDDLRQGAEELGLDAEAVQEFMTLVHEERDPDGPRLRGFLTRVRDGAVALSGAVTTDVVATSLIDLVKAYLNQ
jgi:hypothetical protein